MKRAFTMFHVKMIDMEGNGKCMDYDSPLDTLADVEQAITMLVTTVTHKSNVRLIHTENLLYEVFAGAHNIGTVYIQSI